MNHRGTEALRRLLLILSVSLCLCGSAAATQHTVNLADTNTASESVARQAVYWRGDAISLSWLPPSGAAGNSAYSYNIYRGTSTGDETGPLNPSPVDAGCSSQANCTYVDYGPQAGTTYYYTVTTLNGGTESAQSSETSAEISADTVLDGLSFSEAPLRRWTGVRAASDTNTLSENAAAKHGNVLALGDTLSFSETPARHWAGVRAPADANTLSDSTARSAGRHASLADTLSFSEAAAGSHGQKLALTDTHALGESLARQWAALRAVGDPLSFSEAPAVSYGTVPPHNNTLALSDTLASSEGVARQSASVRGVGDSQSFSEAAARAGTFRRLPADTLSFNEAAASSHGRTLALADTLAPSEALARQRAVLRTPIDTNPASELFGRHWVTRRALGDTLSFNEAAFATRRVRPIPPRHHGGVPGKPKGGDVSGRTKSGAAVGH